MKSIKPFCCVTVALAFSVVCNAEINTNNVANLLDKGEFALAAEVLRDDIDSGMSRADVDVAVAWIEKLTARLRGRDTSMAIRKFVPPDKDAAYKKIVSQELWIEGVKISASMLGIGAFVSTSLVAWKNDAQRVIVANEKLGVTSLISADTAQKELVRFDAVKNAVGALYDVVYTRCKIEGGDRDYYLGIRKHLCSVKERLKEIRTRYLSYEVVSPYLYEAHAHLFAGISDSWRVSSFNRMYPELVEKYKIEGVKLLAKSCHQQWLYSCSEDVRDQFVEVQKFMKENIGECEMKEYKVVMTLSDCNDPSKVRGADSWWK